MVVLSCLLPPFTPARRIPSRASVAKTSCIQTRCYVTISRRLSPSGPTGLAVTRPRQGLPFLKPARDALARTLPNCRRVEFPGLDHGASSDPSTTNPGGKPEIVGQVAREVSSFFATLGSRQPSI